MDGLLTDQSNASALQSMLLALHAAYDEIPCGCAIAIEIAVSITARSCERHTSIIAVIIDAFVSAREALAAALSVFVALFCAKTILDGITVTAASTAIAGRRRITFLQYGPMTRCVHLSVMTLASRVSCLSLRRGKPRLPKRTSRMSFGLVTGG